MQVFQQFDVDNINFIKNETSAQVLSFEFSKIVQPAALLKM